MMPFPTRPYVIVDSRGQILGDLPSPRLIQAGGGEAYEEGAGFWRLRDDSYDTPGTEYTRVRVKKRRECRGFMGISHYVELGTPVVNGLCDECRG